MSKSCRGDITGSIAMGINYQYRYGKNILNLLNIYIKMEK